MMSYQGFILSLLFSRARASCKCIDPVGLGAVTATGGEVAFAGSPSSGVTKVPVSYGTTCKAWDTETDQEYYAACQTDNATWCTDEWCYVDMCNCDKADIGAASYFTVDAKLNLGYSYDACKTSTGGTSAYLETFCTANLASNCTSASCKKVTGSGNATCEPAETTEIKAVCKGKAGCECINPVDIGCVTKSSDDMAKFKGSSVTCEVPKQYGAGCAAWDTAEGMEFYEDCKTDKETWCTSPWCYIDMCSCDAADLASASYFEAHSDLKLGYSYTTCDGTATSTSDYLTTFCAEKEGTACEETTVCKLVDGSCGKKTTDEIKDGQDCSSAKATCSGNPPVTTCEAGGNSTSGNSTAPAPAPAPSDATTTSATDRQCLPSLLATIAAVATIAFAAWGQ